MATLNGAHNLADWFYTTWLGTLARAISLSLIETALLTAVLAGTLLILFYALRTGVPPQSSGRAAREALLSLLPETIDGDIADLGSGWGALAEVLADRYPQNQVVGYELSPIPYWFSCLRLKITPRANLEYRRANFLRADLSTYRAVTCYLMIGAMKVLSAKLNELPDGAVVVSHAFSLRDREADEAIRLSTTGATMYYRYVVHRSGAPYPSAFSVVTPADVAR
ncbi:methyltransferase [Thalassobaculum litoreum]|uniref:Methyltransferase small domain-containing protein n=1 Tax=Thalassobaculum litoreum DSM 18839 TaxID=1123362 RepID=A0A8G2BIN4_9PROT|nr:methyltransferase [Thalassobaculum litoreum]SDF46010.1 Methyltransferase small domain-containing protein [Thalassobaculum litoreum DSM 18839]